MAAGYGCCVAQTAAGNGLLDTPFTFARVKWGLAQSMTWSSPGLMDTFCLKKESVFHAENEEPVPCGIQGAISWAGASWSERREPCARMSLALERSTNGSGRPALTMEIALAI